MNWRDIPSLKALRAFEAAARHGSFSAAARDLNVTHAAVAQHVRALEDHFSQPLMRRSGNAMTLTPEGQPLAHALGEAFGLIGTATRDLLDRGSARALRVALTPSFAANWLMPRIGRFWARHPDVPLELIPSNRLVDLRAEGMDIAIRYGRGPWSGVDSMPLVPAGHVAVGAPGRYGHLSPDNLSELTGETWLVDTIRSEERLWARANGLDLDSERVLTFDTAQLTREAAKAGLGIAILPAPIVADEVAAGTLLKLCAEEGSALAYHVVTRPGTLLPARDIFISWLKDEART
ncbi:LysR family transcriptional regulator [Roseisalinus antarcticus]|uniref:Glycine cleavage system transcriptional activator n=1 Tax=Roseisalinus antarcticus TaxID=254357 RepID=A0A1Y5S5I8_9RHOB|nr:LysR family transcriptional regulator [Roseisalinus antarcticus]SLN30500.1 Glycine cleavage system transcriptional activator [Roseisalinus antarcticus]